MTEAAVEIVPDLPAAAGRSIAGLAARLEAERDRWALWIPVGFATGVGGYFALEREPAAWLGPAVLGVAVAAGVLGRRRLGLLLACLALAVVSAGFAAAQFRTALVARRSWKSASARSPFPGASSPSSAARRAGV